MKQKKLDFTQKKFHSLLLTSTFTMVVECLILLSDTVVVGHLIGEDGISGINMVTPIFSVVAFVSMLIGMGTVYRFTHEMGRFNKDRADRLYGQGIILAVGMGVILFLIVTLGESMYFHFMGPSAEVLKWAKDYYRFFRFTVLLYPLYTYLAEMVYADGDEAACLASYVAQIGGNIVLSIFLCMKMGTAGASLGTLIGTIMSLLIVSTHFFKKKCALKFVPHFNLKDVVEVCTYSIVDAGLYLFWGILSMVMNKVFISQFGDHYLPVLSVLISLIELTIIFDGIAEAVTPLFNLYNGEKNQTGIRRLMRTATRTCLVEGIIYTVLLFVGARMIPLLFDITDPELVRISMTAIRIFTPTAILTALLFLYTSYYLMMEHIGPAFFIVAMKDLGFPVLFALILSHPFGMHGVWIAFLISPAAALLLGILVSLKLYGRKKFPLFLDTEQPPTFIHSFTVVPEEIIRVRDEVAEELRALKINETSVTRIMLLIEEAYLAIREKNGSSSIISELSVIVRDEVQLVFKDNGEVFDLTKDEEAMTSFSGYVVSSLIDRVPVSQYLLTASFNRSMFCFPK